MGNNLSWLYLAGAVGVAAVVVSRRGPRVTVAPGETVTLLGDDLAEAVRRPLRHLLATSKVKLVAQNTGSTWATTHAMMGIPSPSSPVILAAGFTLDRSMFPQRNEVDRVASFCRSFPRMLVVVSPGGPESDVLASGAKQAGVALCTLRPCPPELRGPHGCAPSLAAAAGWAAEIASHLS